MVLSTEQYSLMAVLALIVAGVALLARLGEPALATDPGTGTSFEDYYTYVAQHSNSRMAPRADEARLDYEEAMHLVLTTYAYF